MSDARPSVGVFLLRGRGAVDVTPPGLPSQKTARVVWGGVCFVGTPRLGAGTPGVVSIDCNTLQQSDCENVHL